MFTTFGVNLFWNLNLIKMISKIGDTGYLKSGKDAPWELGESYHGARFLVISRMYHNGRPCVCLEMTAKDGRRLRRWTTEAMFRYIANHPSPQPEPIKKITRFDFKSGMNPEIYHYR